MAPQRPTSPFWDRDQQNELDEAQAPEQSDFGSALKGLFKNLVNPNKPDPSNPVVHGASQPTRAPFLRNLIADVATQASRTGVNLHLLRSLAETTIFNGGVVDDKAYELEHIVQLAASLPQDSGFQNDLGGKFIDLLWNNLEHPPLSKLGDTYKYRTADGSNNNVMYPHLGKAGSSYARTVIPQTYQPGTLPDPEVVFDSLFARGPNPQEHPNKLSSMLFYWASIIIHDIFHTDERDPSKVKTSSYLDLAPLYGSSDEELAKIRTFKDGLLKPDSFCEGRILGFPPGVAALLVCFNRYHNYVAIQLKEINERGRFTPPTNPNDQRGLAKMDNDLFQTARLITCGLYVNIILTDYVRTILNLNRTDNTWTLDPRENFKSFFDEKGVPSGIGNQVSVEFNLVYRWHSAISVKDEAWTNAAYQRLFPGKDVAQMTETEFKSGLRAWVATLNPDPAAWDLDFGNFTRTERGTFRDGDLVQILTEATKDVACAFGARQVPIAMKLVEIMGIKQAREWNVATLNEFRKFFHLKPYTKFADISSDPHVAHALKALYKYPDYVELYPGLIAEDAKKAMDPGSGLCPGYTISRAILADAVALVRGDRFYTIDNSPSSLTNWGYNQIQSDPEVAQGHVIHNLIMRALPNWYRSNSVFAMFPFVVPEENRAILEKMEKDHEYSFAAPKFIPVPQVTKTYQAVIDVLGDQNTFRVPWGPHTQALIGNKYTYMLSADDATATVQRKMVQGALYQPTDGLKHVRDFYEALTTQLVEIRSEKLRDSWYQLDACRDVANPSHAIFVARLWHIPLKGANDRTLGVEVDKLYLALAISFAYVFLDLDTAKSFKLGVAAKSACEQLSLLLKGVCEAIKVGRTLNISRLFDMGDKGQLLGDYGKRLITRLLKGDKTVDEVVSIIIPTAAAAVATQAQHFTSLLDVYLSEPYNKHWPAIQACAWSEDPADFEKLKMYALEANRLRPAAYGLLRKAASKTTVHDGDNEIPLEMDDQIYLNFIAAGRDPTKFPHPDEIDITRDKSLYIHHGYGAHACLGRPMVEVAMAAQLRVFAKLKNLRRAPGLQGMMKKTVPAPNPVSSDPVPNTAGITVYMREDYSDWWPFPTTLKVHHDGFYKDQDEQLGLDTGLPHRATDLQESREANGDSNGLAPDSVVNGAGPEIHLNGNHDASANGIPEATTSGH